MMEDPRGLNVCSICVCNKVVSYMVILVVVKRYTLIKVKINY